MYLELWGVGLKLWNYTNGVPNLPVVIYGKEFTIREQGLIDSGATYCILHPDLCEVLNLEKIRETHVFGFGSNMPFQVDILDAVIELIDKKNCVEIAMIPRDKYPETAPKVIIGRNLLNFYIVTLDGINQKIIIKSE